MTVTALEAKDLRGTWRRFGAAGPVYEIIGIAPRNRRGEAMMRIRVVESGEEIDYRLDDVLDDPRET